MGDHCRVAGEGQADLQMKVEKKQWAGAERGKARQMDSVLPMDLRREHLFEIFLPC